MNARTTTSLAIALFTAGTALAQSATQGDAPARSALAPLASYRGAAPRDAARPGAARAPSPARAEARDLSAFPGIPVMPPYTVLEPGAQGFRARDLYTRDGMIDQSFRHHPGLLVGNPFGLNRSAAYEQFMADDWRATKGDYEDMAHAMSQGGDPREGRLIVDEVNDEDVRMRGEAEQDAAAPTLGRFQIASAQTGTRGIEISEIPINISFVRITW